MTTKAMIILDITSFEIFINMVQFIVPALLVLLVTYFTMKRFFDDAEKKRELKYKRKNSEKLTPIRLQAYERLTILLERMKPENLVLRLADNRMNATQYKHNLVNTINEEYSHNISQQIYISDQAWQMVKLIKEDTINVIENCYKDMPEQAKATDLGKAVFEEVMKRNEDRVQSAINFIKKEIDLVF